MSGLCGLRSLTGSTPDVDVLAALTAGLHHRGPDGSGTWVGPDIGLGHTLLALTPDRSATGEQPCRSGDGRWVVVLDGEVLNRTSLRAWLDRRLRSGSDAEIVAEGLATEGISFVERLSGVVALVAHDLLTGTTHLVRDRLGVLPLHYRLLPDAIAFASEITPLLACGGRPEVDLRALDDHLAARTPAAADTLFEGVKRVLPGHRLSIGRSGHVEEVAWWAPPQPDAERSWTMSDAIEAVGDGVREATRAAMGEAPVGARLSGDLASSLLASQAQRLRPDQPLPTFSAVVDLGDGEEQALTRRVSALLGTTHHEVHLGAVDFQDSWAQLTHHREAPVADPSDVADLAVARTAGEHVRVLLTADGASELFGDYPRHRLARIAERTTVLPDRLRTRMSGRLDRGPATPFSPAERHRLLGTSPDDAEAYDLVHDAYSVERMLHDDVCDWLPSHVLERADRLGMASSVAPRPALLDQRLVELAFRLPSSIRVRSGSAGWLLREVARPFLPEAMIDRRPAATRIPLDAWFRTGLRDAAHDWLTAGDSWVTTRLDRAAVLDVLRRHEHGHDAGGAIWALLSLEMWHRSFFGASPAVPRPRAQARETSSHGAR